MTKTEQDIINAVNDHYGMEIPFTRPTWVNAWDVSLEDVTVRFLVDDEEARDVRVYVFTGGGALLLNATAKFTNMPAAVVANVITHHLDAALVSA